MSHIKTNEKLNQQKIKSNFLEDSESLEMKIWVISPSKESQPVEVLTEGRGNTEWVEENESHRYELWSLEQLQKQGLQYLYMLCISLLYPCGYLYLLIIFLSLLPTFILY